MTGITSTAVPRALWWTECGLGFWSNYILLGNALCMINGTRKINGRGEGKEKSSISILILEQRVSWVERAGFSLHITSLEMSSLIAFRERSCEPFHIRPIFAFFITLLGHNYFTTPLLLIYLFIYNCLSALWGQSSHLSYHCCILSTYFVAWHSVFAQICL